LRLADLAEPIFAALAAGEITLDVAQAYGSTGDRERQAAAWERLSTSWQADNPQAIRRAIAEESLSADHPIARFLGEAEYVACGGRIERDLFAADGEGRWLDGDLAMDLAAKKLAHEAEVAELGSKLAWVKPTLATHVTYDETKDLHAYWPRRAEPSAEALARMDEISDRMTEISEILDAPDDGDDVEALEAEYNALDAEHDRLSDTDLLIPDEDKPNVGTFLVLGKDGQPRLLETYYTATKPHGGPAHLVKRPVTPRPRNPRLRPACRVRSKSRWPRIAAMCWRSTSPMIRRWRSIWRSSAWHAIMRAFRLFRYRLHHPHHRSQRTFGPDRHSGQFGGDRTRAAARQPAQ
jgi:ParB family chromosome partitioning protein